MSTATRQLVVFADDWGRHPSSAQHLVRHLLPSLPGGALWVNTVGTRRPRLTVGDLKRAVAALRAKPRAAAELPPGLRVIAPRMYPGFRTPWQRRLNARQLTRAVARALTPADPPGDAPAASGRTLAGSPGVTRRVAVTTLPITADLVAPGRLPGVDRWVYYCVDDFSVWPGLDGGVMDAMERELVAKVDAVVAVSETLVARMRAMGRDDVTLLTHGVDLDHWRAAGEAPHVHAGLHEHPPFLFWGLIDARLDVDWVNLLRVQGRIQLVGPVGAPAVLKAIVMGATGPDQVRYPGPVDLANLPSVARDARVLIMPYIDAPVTRAMQPLKLLEYLATYKPVVVRDLPATRAWADCCDVVSTPEDFVWVCLERARTGLPAEQRAARERRLPGESWAAKAAALEAVLWPEAAG